MALINCNECGREISDKATSCIHCGYPLNNKTLSNPTSKKKLYVIVAIIILALIIFITLNSKNIYGTYKQLDLTDGKEGTLTLYENGTCHWQFYRISTEGTFFEHDKEFSAYRCKYSYTNDKLVITTDNVSDKYCNFNKNTIVCEDGYGSYKK